MQSSDQDICSVDKLNKFAVHKNSHGFTIIEVALVLAIAAVIFAVVFLAVPALQRNQRDDARRRDLASAASMLQTYLTNTDSKCNSSDIKRYFLSHKKEFSSFTGSDSKWDIITAGDGVLVDCSYEWPNQYKARGWIPDLPPIKWSGQRALKDGWQNVLYIGVGKCKEARGLSFHENGSLVCDNSKNIYTLFTLLESGGGTWYTKEIST
jgi:prepilin-type N-terminal cleavage/methylation domain-containing protein